MLHHILGPGQELGLFYDRQVAQDDDGDLLRLVVHGEARIAENGAQMAHQLLPIKARS